MHNSCCVHRNYDSETSLENLESSHHERKKYFFLFFFQVVLALEYLHSHGIIHRLNLHKHQLLHANSSSFYSGLNEIEYMIVLGKC